MPQIDEPTTPAPKAAPEVKKPKHPAAADKPVGGVYSFTVNTADGRIVMVERVETDGTRHQLSPEEKTKLAAVKTAMPLRRLVEQAFEAGIEFVLGEGEEAQESKEDGELSSILLQTLLESSKAKELVKGETLDRTVVDTLIGRAAKSAGPVAH